VGVYQTLCFRNPRDNDFFQYRMEYDLGKSDDASIVPLPPSMERALYYNYTKMPPKFTHKVIHTSDPNVPVNQRSKPFHCTFVSAFGTPRKNILWHATGVVKPSQGISREIFRRQGNRTILLFEVEPSEEYV